MGMLEAVGEVFPEAKYQRCTVHFYRNVFSVVPKSKVKNVAKMLKAIHAQENKKAAREKAKAVAADLRAMKLPEAAKKVESGIEETLTYCDFLTEHWIKIRTNKYHRAAEPGDPAQDPGCGCISGQQLCADAGVCPAASRSRNSVGL